MSTSFDTWVAALITLAMFSLAIYKENPVYRLAEHAFIGIGAGHAIVTGVQVIQTSGINPLLKNAEYRLLIPMFFGILLFARYSKSYAYLSRLSMSLIVATGAGLGLRGAVQAQFLNQISATFLPLNSINNILIVVGFVTGLTYFIFSTRYTRYLNGKLSVVPRIGRCFLMIAFGASFGNASMGFLSMLIGRVLFLVRDWLGLSSLR
ncbi:MAG: hypothetical protein IMF26_05215 [Candidatus Fermentithermobacillus carboniphilus]|uniref:Uncharacterized protein n=1 Tax=Candidatus Fermentithermobacillus carboniphilus TaxID=3085328 RepID=A0AAT9LFE0_9FIRM|nr:MAG: hypothetical protein IMF26_05215 [Candidatus Fermentithermobacillus carboniphilus]